MDARAVHMCLCLTIVGSSHYDFLHSDLLVCQSQARLSAALYLCEGCLQAILVNSLRGIPAAMVHIILVLASVKTLPGRLATSCQCGNRETGLRKVDLTSKPFLATLVVQQLS